MVTIEESVNGFTDLIARKEDDVLAVEIETGKSDWRANLTKNQQKGFRHMLIAATNENAYKDIQGALEAEPLNETAVQVVLAWEVRTKLTQHEIRT